MFKNHEIVLSKAADPFLTRFDDLDTYVYLRSAPGDRKIQLGLSPTLEKNDLSAMKMIDIDWDASKHPDCNKHIWAPEMHEVMGQLAILFTGDDGRNRSHRMHALVADDPKDPTSRFRYAGPVTTPDNQWAIDMTYFYDDRPRIAPENHALYAIWSGWPGNNNREQHIYIAKTKRNDPFKFESERVEIAVPEHPWERNVDRSILEGPAIAKHGGEVDLLISSNCSWTSFYNIVGMRLKGDDPMDKSSWRKTDRPLLQTHANIYGPGHPSVTHDKYGNLVMAYHSARSRYSGWDRVGRLCMLENDARGELYVPDYVAPLSQRTPNYAQWAVAHMALAGNVLLSTAAASLVRE